MAARCAPCLQPGKSAKKRLNDQSEHDHDRHRNMEVKSMPAIYSPSLDLFPSREQLGCGIGEGGRWIQPVLKVLTVDEENSKGSESEAST